MADPNVTFTKTVAVLDTALVLKAFNINAFVLGNSAMANATADALGPNTHTETLTTTAAVQFVGSSSVSESVSATNNFHFANFI
jgi:hypothetical protein